MVDEVGEIRFPNIYERRIEQVNTLTALTMHAHKRIIEETGGTFGIRDKAALESAVSAPFATFGGEELYPTIYKKAAVIMNLLSLNHPMIDGNKRTSLFMAHELLFEHGYGFKQELDDDSIVEHCVEVAKGNKSIDETAEWLKANTDKASARHFDEVMKKLQKQ